MSKRVVITGGSGFIGTAISWALLEKQFEVVSLDIEPPATGRVMFVETDLAEGIPRHHFLEKPTYIINLAGAPIFGRWTRGKKEQIYHSRVAGTKNLIKLIENPRYRPEALISASATGFYGHNGTLNITERTQAGEGFLARVANDWEEMAREAEKLGVRTTVIRNSHVLGPGGIIAKLRLLSKFKVIPQVGDSHACLPWIHITDLVNLYIESMLEPNAPDTINAVAPQISTHAEFARIAAKVTGSKKIKLPQSLINILLGDLAVEMSYSQCVRSEAISPRYIFKYPNLKSAIKATLQR